MTTPTTSALDRAEAQVAASRTEAKRLALADPLTVALVRARLADIRRSESGGMPADQRPHQILDSIIDAEVERQRRL